MLILYSHNNVTGHILVLKVGIIATVIETYKVKNVCSLSPKT